MNCFISYSYSNLRGLCAHSGEATLSSCFCHPSEKRVYSKRKEFAPWGSKFFPFRVDPFLEVTWCPGNETGCHKCCRPFTKWHKIYLLELYSVLLTDSSIEPDGLSEQFVTNTKCSKNILIYSVQIFIFPRLFLNVIFFGRWILLPADWFSAVCNDLLQYTTKRMSSI